MNSDEPWLSERTIQMRQKLDEMTKRTDVDYKTLIEYGVHVADSSFRDIQAWDAAADLLTTIKNRE